MSRLRQLRLDNHRNLATTTLELHPRCTLISGKNGSGKTALLEAIYLLGRGKSFRENQTRHLIAHDQPYLRLIARIEKNGEEHLLGIEKSIDILAMNPVAATTLLPEKVQTALKQAATEKNKRISWYKRCKHLLFKRIKDGDKRTLVFFSSLKFSYRKKSKPRPSENAVHYTNYR